MDKIIQILTQIVKIAKLPFRVIVFIVIASGVLFFLPSSARDYLLMTEFYSAVGPYLGPLFIVSLLYVVFVVFCWMIIFLLGNRKKRKEAKTIKERLNSLSTKEILVLREFLFQQSDVITATMEDEGVVSLLSKKIIIMVQKPMLMYSFGTPIKVQINSEIKDCFSQKLLNISSNSTKDDWIKYESERPAFVYNIQGFQDLQNSVFNPIPKFPRR